MPIPIDPRSPWPRFRCNARQDGRSSNVPAGDSRQDRNRPWTFSTGKGIFSSPVIDGDGVVYIGSADHFFYAIHPDGSEKWRFATGDIIDSSALLDDRGRIYFGSGDGYVYCLDRDSGTEVWRFRSHSPDEVRKEYGIKTYNLAWFEGNIAMTPGGTILVPNDNYLIYELERDTGSLVRIYPANEMGWSCPAVNETTGRLFFGSVFVALRNLFSYDLETGRRCWVRGGLGTVAASPLLDSDDPDGIVVAGGFDGILRAWGQKRGRRRWTFGTREHLYSSPARLSDGTIIQSSADGTVYGIEPRRGTLLWTFDTTEPIRSSPAVDSSDRIYFGSGEGRLYCLNGDGTYRWSYRCIDGDRRDLNGSPGLGPDGVIIGGEDGGVRFVPWDYPLGDEGRRDSRCVRDEMPPRGNGAVLRCRNGFGRIFDSPPAVDANRSLDLVLQVRRDGRETVAAIDPRSLSVDVDGDQTFSWSLSADRRYITLVPEDFWNVAGDKEDSVDREIRIRVKGFVRTKLRRFGLKFFGGRRTYHIDTEIVVPVNAGPGESAGSGESAGLLRPGRVIELRRLTCPSPSLLPSYNQIGFDSLHYLAAIIDGDDRVGRCWVVPGRFDEATGRTVVDPGQDDVFVLEYRCSGGLLVLDNTEGFAISFFGSWDMPFARFRFAAGLDAGTGDFTAPAGMNAVIHAADIKFYGRFLKMMGVAAGRRGRMNVSGAADIAFWDGGDPLDVPGGVDPPIPVRDGRNISVDVSRYSLPAGVQVYGLLLLDVETGKALPVNFARRTLRETGSAPAGNAVVDRKTAGTGEIITRLTVDCRGIRRIPRLRVLVMADTGIVADIREPE